MNQKRLVAYFSCSGVTEKMAETLAEAAGADIYEIRPEVPYTPADLNWNNKKNRSSVEMGNPDSHPRIADWIDGIERYDTVLIGFPIWWYTAPMIIKTFLESYDFSGKTVVPFATSGGSGLGKTAADLKPCCSATTVWKPGRMLNGRQSKDALAIWADTLK